MKIEEFKNSLKEKRFQFIRKIHKDSSQVKVFLVGGAVRDLINNSAVPPEDLDFVVEGIERNELEEFLEKNGIVKDVESRAFGVFIFIPKGEKNSFDIALPRDEHWLGEGYKDIEVKTEGLSIKDDLARRDFTINAMALNLRNFELVDEFKGKEDLKNKIIRTVGKPEERFQEDPSRILRGVRFAVQLNFKIDEATFVGMKDKLIEITKPIEDDISKKRVAEEVIAKEFLKAFNKNLVKTLKLYDQVGLLEELLDEVKAMQGVKQPQNFHSEGDVYKHTLLALDKLKESKPVIGKDNKISINLKLALLFHDIGKPQTYTPPEGKDDRIHFNEHDEIGAKIVKEIIDRLKLTSQAPESGLHVDEETVIWLVRKHMILITAKPEEMKLTTFEKYFFREDGVGDELLRLSWADISATIPPSGKPDYSIYNAFVKKINEIRETVKTKQKERTLPESLINGNDVMKVLKIKSGPRVGEVLAKIRELQLKGTIKTKEEALKKVKNL
ncbi:MAG: HD domain-containing protein [Candidatus Berkelbacteria bacterium]|nr:HD domain-containing protein [Candidatus Berkelbacteria bacterium]